MPPPHKTMSRLARLTLCIGDRDNTGVSKHSLVVKYPSGFSELAFLFNGVTSPKQRPWGSASPFYRQQTKAQREKGNPGPWPADGPSAPGLETAPNLCHGYLVAPLLQYLFFVFFLVKGLLVFSLYVTTQNKDRTSWPSLQLGVGQVLASGDE